MTGQFTCTMYLLCRKMCSSQNTITSSCCRLFRDAEASDHSPASEGLSLECPLEWCEERRGRGEWGEDGEWEVTLHQPATNPPEQYVPLCTGETPYCNYCLFTD